MTERADRTIESTHLSDGTLIEVSRSPVGRRYVFMRAGPESMRPPYDAPEIHFELLKSEALQMYVEALRADVMEEYQ